jgi:uncharacterized protein
MTTAVVDTNIIVAGMLTQSPRSASRELIDRLFAGDFELLLSTAALAEIQHVLALPQMQAIHHLTDDEIQQFCRALAVRSRMLSGNVEVSPAITRDISDTKWIALAIEGDADFLVSRDRRHLNRLKTVGRTQIVTAHAFLKSLAKTRRAAE